MKRKLLIGSFIVVAFGLPLTASAADWDCFPLCAEPAKTEAHVQAAAAGVTLDTVSVVTTREATINTDTPTSCGNGFMQQAEDLNNKVKPIKEIIGYVRSPQGLAIKLVNDHIVKIPAWIGYAMDPLGSLKRKAFDEVRTRAKGALTDGNNGNACGVAPEADFFNTVSDLDAIDAAEAKRST